MSGILDAPPSIPGIPGLQNMLQNGGWQPLAGTGCNLSDATGTNSLVLQRTSRVNVIPAFSSNFIQLVYANYSNGGSAGVGEYPGLATPKLHVFLEYSAIGSETNETGVRIPVTFNGKKYIDVEPNAIVYSDPIPFSAVAGVPFFIRNCQSLAGTNLQFPAGYFVKGGTNPGGTNATGEGFTATDVTETGTILQTQNALCYAPSVILGWVPNAIPSAGIKGDSITDNTADGGMPQNSGGYLHRLVTGQVNRVYTYPVTPPIGFVKCARGGETLAGYLTNNKNRVRLLKHCSTIINEYGRNDLGVSTLAQIKANLLVDANYWLAQGKTYIACTLVPNVTSTDGFATTANQTQYSTESDRQAINTWLRTTFASLTIKPGNVTIYDAAAAVEVNSSNVLTLNGGYWKLSGSAIVTGTFTFVNGALNFQDNTKTWTQDQYRGYCLRITSGSASGSQSDIMSNSTNGLLSLVNVTGVLAPSVGDTFKIFDCYTADGIHPTALGHMTIANSLNINQIK